jgi:hypothetical protein
MSKRFIIWNRESTCLYFFIRNTPKLAKTIRTEGARPYAPRRQPRCMRPSRLARGGVAAAKLLLGPGQVATLLLASACIGHSSHLALPHPGCSGALILPSTRWSMVLTAEDELRPSCPSWYWNRWNLHGMDLHASEGNPNTHCIYGPMGCVQGRSYSQASMSADIDDLTVVFYTYLLISFCHGAK